ncbi:hypothetical protein BJ170DRAFT_12465 [Xylariales sp. AK1849]|nr:hypothetical protein BJ170DRAFT_12465 [Xylariales sp. AK1849]
MALTIKHLNSDASFQLSFEPVRTQSGQSSVVIPRPFTILLDPWITGPSKIFHSKISISTHKHPACVSSLSELPEPDLVIISQHKSDHCNEATLRQLRPTDTKTLILAEPASARLIKSWKYFDHDKIRTIERWEDPRATGRSTVLRIPVPPVTPGGQKGEVTVAWIPQKRDLAGLHGAIGITYRPPPTPTLAKLAVPATIILTPPTTPESTRAPITPSFSTTDILIPPSPPISPHPLRSVHSASTLLPSPTQLTHLAPTFNRAIDPRPNSSAARPPSGTSRPISLLFSPHGISYSHLGPYATSHLVAEAALPLTALLHCMDSISNPWWLGGNISAGVPAGAEIALKLGARVWVSAHDGEKDVRGLATGMLRTRKWRREEVMEVVSPRFGAGNGVAKGFGDGNGYGTKVTEVLRLGSGEEVVVCGDGMVLSSAKVGKEEEEEEEGLEEQTKKNDQETPLEISRG